MDLMRCCPWSTGGVDNFLYTAPCPPPIMTYSDFQTFVLDRNFSQTEFSIIANKCNVLSLSTTAADSTSSISTTTIHRTSDIPHTADTTEVSSNVTLHITITTASFPTSHVTPPVTTPYPGDVLIIGVTCGIAAVIILSLLAFLLVMKHRKQESGESQNRTTHVLVCVSISCDNYSNNTSGTNISSERSNETEITLETFANSLTVSESVAFQNKTDKKNKTDKQNNDVSLEKKNDSERSSSASDNKKEHNTDCFTAENDMEHEYDYVEGDYEYVSEDTDDETKQENDFMKLDNKIEHNYDVILSDKNTNHKACGIDDE